MKKKLLILSDAQAFDMREIYEAEIVIVVYPSGKFTYHKARKNEIMGYDIQGISFPASVFNAHVEVCLQEIGVKQPRLTEKV